MNTHETLEARYYEWVSDPEPEVPEMDPKVILDTDGSYDAYLWHTMESSETWLAYSGDLANVTE